MNFTPDEWHEPFSNGDLPWDGRFHSARERRHDRADEYMDVVSELFDS